MERVILLLFFACLSHNLMALDAVHVDRYKQRLTDLNPKVRFEAIEELGNLAANSPESIGKEVVEMEINALSDSDSEVRHNAIGSIAILAIRTQPAHYPVKPGMFDLRKCPSLKEALELAMTDDKKEIKRAALGAYAFVFKFTPEFQQKLIAGFEKEEKSNRILIASALIMDGNFNEAVTQLLLRLLDDPEYDWFIANDLSHVETALPPAVFLPKPAEKLAKATDVPHKEACASGLPPNFDPLAMRVLVGFRGLGCW